MEHDDGDDDGDDDVDDFCQVMIIDMRKQDTQRT